MNRRDVLKAFTLTAAALGILGTSNRKETELTQYCLGKLPARPHYGLKLRDYITPSQLPAVPDNFGHENLISHWGMLGNGPGPENPTTAPDGVGDCAIAGPFHSEMLWCAEGNKQVNVNTACTLAAYSAITGYDPTQYNPHTGQNPTDQGSNIQKVADYWRTTGLTDASGVVHKIDAYMSIEPKNVEQLYYALYLFDGIGIGVEFPGEWMRSFSLGQVWDAVKHPTIEGGHLIAGVGRRAGLINTVSWGRTQLLTPAGYEQFNDETFCYLSAEKLVNGKDVNGFDVEQLLADMADLNKLGIDGPPTEPIPLCEIQEALKKEETLV